VKHVPSISFLLTSSFEYFVNSACNINWTSVSAVLKLSWFRCHPIATQARAAARCLTNLPHEIRFESSVFPEIKNGLFCM
jgi:hypothetical protein